MRTVQVQDGWVWTVEPAGFEGTYHRDGRHFVDAHFTYYLAGSSAPIMRMRGRVICNSLADATDAELRDGLYDALPRRGEQPPTEYGTW